VIVHLDGRLVPAAQARVSPFDRGFLFGDGVYEGLRSFGGAVVGLDAHVARLADGLGECRIKGFDPRSLGPLTADLLRANAMDDAFIYWQVTRGAPPNLDDPSAVRTRVPGGQAPLKPTVFGFCTPLPPLNAYREPPTRTAAVRPDTRWMRGHVKSISLIGGVLAALEADEQRADDAILVRDGGVTEGVATNVFIAKGGLIATPPVRALPILAGVTRRLLLEAEPSIEVREIAEAELRAADEIMLVGTSTMVTAVTALDGRPVGGGAAGPAARRLLASLVSAIRAEAAAASL
jgi:D-alanine transaminase